MKIKTILSAGIISVCFAAESHALTITNTTNTTALATALGGGGGLTVNSVAYTNGASTQIGTYTDFTSAPVTLGDGVVMSTGLATQTTAAFISGGNSPDTTTGAGSTAEFNAYGPGHITNFSSSNDVARLVVNFTLAVASQVSYQFVFGSVEYPVYASNYTDAFLAFLDGTAVANQIMFDGSNNAVQVGGSFAGSLTTADTNTAFAGVHGLLKLKTTTALLAAGVHTLTFEVGDVNDGALDSAAFITNLQGDSGTAGTSTSVPDSGSTVAMLGAALAGIAGLRRKFGV